MMPKISLNITDTGNITDTDNALDRINPLLKELLDMDTQRKYFEQKVPKAVTPLSPQYTASSILWNRIVKSSAGCKRNGFKKPADRG